MLPAQDLYTGALFKKSLQYAQTKITPKPDKIFILSAKHHVVDLSQKLAHYDLYLGKMRSADRKAWAKETLRQLKANGCDLAKDKFIFLTGKDYYVNLLPDIKNYSVPMAGLKYGQKLQWLNTNIINTITLLIQHYEGFC